jgi:hypothetical protein
MDNHSESLAGLELYDLHRPLNGSTAVGVASADDCPDADGAIRYLLELHVRIPARMVADVLMSVEMKRLGHWSVDYLRNLNSH